MNNSVDNLLQGKSEREMMEDMLEDEHTSENRKQSIRTYLEASDLLDQGNKPSQLIKGSKRLEDESYQEYKDRLKLESEILRQYNAGDVLDNPGGGTYIQSRDGEVKSDRHVKKKTITDA